VLQHGGAKPLHSLDGARSRTQPAVQLASSSPSNRRTETRGAAAGLGSAARRL
jgi:hypothetical protein